MNLFHEQAHYRIIFVLLPNPLQVQWICFMSKHTTELYYPIHWKYSESFPWASTLQNNNIHSIQIHLFAGHGKRFHTVQFAQWQQSILHCASAQWQQSILIFTLCKIAYRYRVFYSVHTHLLHTHMQAHTHASTHTHTQSMCAHIHWVKIAKHNNMHTHTELK